MIFFPAIDLKDGQCVRLLRGDMSAATVYGDDPAAQARSFASAGCQWLHVVDLNGAVSGEAVNGRAIENILDAVAIPVQVGGGIRSVEAAGSWLEKGVARVVLGTVAVREPDVVKEACNNFPGQVAVGIDARGGKVAVQGWTETSDIMAAELAKRLEGVGVAAIIYTDIDRDGAETGPNIEATLALAEAIETPVIASGGVASLADLVGLREAAGDKLEGVISGRAVYEGSIDPMQAVLILAGDGQTC